MYQKSCKHHVLLLVTEFSKPWQQHLQKLCMGTVMYERSCSVVCHAANWHVLPGQLQHYQEYLRVSYTFKSSLLLPAVCMHTAWHNRYGSKHRVKQPEENSYADLRNTKQPIWTPHHTQAAGESSYNLHSMSSLAGVRRYKCITVGANSLAWLAII